MGYIGEGADLQEGVTCYDAETANSSGARRTATTSATPFISVTPPPARPLTRKRATFTCRARRASSRALRRTANCSGKHSLMEGFGRLTFPNSRTASPLIDRDYVITRGITANWGAQGPAGDRIYAFDKKTGELVWSSATGERPKDNSYSHPYLGWRNGVRVFYTATGDGNVFCGNARTGEPLWRVKVAKAGAKGGINGAVIRSTRTTRSSPSTNRRILIPPRSGAWRRMKIPNLQHHQDESAGAPCVRSHRRNLSSCGASRSRLDFASVRPILVGDTHLRSRTAPGDLCVRGREHRQGSTGSTSWASSSAKARPDATRTASSTCAILDTSAQGADKVAATGEADSGVQRRPITSSSRRTRLAAKMAQPDLRSNGRCYGSPVALQRQALPSKPTKKLYCVRSQGRE